MAIRTDIREDALQRKTKTVIAAIIPRILPSTKEPRVTGLDISRRTVPFFISRLIVCAAQTTATTRLKTRVVAMELSTTSLICSRKTNIAAVGNSPIIINALASIRK